MKLEWVAGLIRSLGGPGFRAHPPAAAGVFVLAPSRSGFLPFDPYAWLTPRPCLGPKQEKIP